MANRTEFPASGVNGAKPGSLLEHRFNGEVIDPKGRVELKPGDRLTLFEAGGGGFGEA